MTTLPGPVIYLCKQAPEGHWNLGRPGVSLDDTSDAPVDHWALVGWPRPGWPADEAVPEYVVEILCSALTRLGPTAFAIDDTTAVASGAPLQRAAVWWRACTRSWRRSPSRVHWKVVDNPTDAQQLFFQTQFPWWAQAQVALALRPDAALPRLDADMWRTLTTGGGVPLEFREEGSPVLGLLRPAADGAMAGFQASSAQSLQRWLMELARAVGEHGARLELLPRDAFARALSLPEPR